MAVFVCILDRGFGLWLGALYSALGFQASFPFASFRASIHLLLSLPLTDFGRQSILAVWPQSRDDFPFPGALPLVLNA